MKRMHHYLIVTDIKFCCAIYKLLIHWARVWYDGCWVELHVHHVFRNAFRFRLCQVTATHWSWNVRNKLGYLRITLPVIGDKPCAWKPGQFRMSANVEKFKLTWKLNHIFYRTIVSSCSYNHSACIEKRVWSVYVHVTWLSPAQHHVSLRRQPAMKTSGCEAQTILEGYWAECVLPIWISPIL